LSGKSDSTAKAGSAGDIIIAADADAAAAELAAFIAGLIAAKRTGRFRFALTGGATPRPLYEKLAGMAIDWRGVDFFWGDERFVPYDSDESNFAMARRILLSHIAVTDSQIHPIPVAGTLEAAAQSYEAVLKARYGAALLDPARPLFDCLLLGLGADGHLASLLPGQPVLEERTGWAAPVPEGASRPRITLTYPALESSAVTVFFVTGSGKAEALRGARAGNPALPAGRFRPQGRLRWFVDKAAAKGME
jgi:6-phosphogluconolactonase